MPLPEAIKPTAHLRAGFIPATYAKVTALTFWRNDLPRCVNLRMHSHQPIVGEKASQLEAEG